MVRRSSRLNVDCLESREVLSGNVTAYVANNTLFLVEAAGQYGQSNAVGVTQLSNGDIRVSGLLNVAGTYTKINGAGHQDFAIPGGSLVASLGAGNDRLKVFNAKFDTMNLDLSYPNTNDADTIDVRGVNTTGAVQLRTGGGSDHIIVQNSRIGDGTGFEDLNINSGAGSDSVQVGSPTDFVDVRGNLILNTWSSLAEQDPDTVSIVGTTVHKSIVLDTGGGNDTIQMSGDAAGGAIAVVAGDGNDTANLREVWSYHDFFIGMATGNDRLTIEYLRAINLNVDGGPGDDVLYHYTDGPTETTTYTDWEWINGHHTFNWDSVPVGGTLSL